jgi:hypothetical protein
LVSFLNDDEISPISFPYHLNGSGHTRDARADDQKVRSVRIPAIVDRGEGVRISHLDLRAVEVVDVERKLGLSKEVLEGSLCEELWDKESIDVRMGIREVQRRG